MHVILYLFAYSDSLILDDDFMVFCATKWKNEIHVSLQEWKAFSVPENKILFVFPYEVKIDSFINADLFQSKINDPAFILIIYDVYSERVKSQIL